MMFAAPQDVDIFVNDYYLFKSVTGARAVNTDSMREQNSGEDVQSRISIGGKEIAFDVRFIGDGYVDGAWMGGVLKRRQLAPSGADPSMQVYIPSSQDYLYLLVYHCLIQKQVCDHLSQRVTDYFLPLAQTVLVGHETPPNEMFTADTLKKKKAPLWDLLTYFLQTNQYTCTCPHDKGVQVHLDTPRAFQKRVPSCSAKQNCVKVKLGEQIRHPDYGKCDIPDAAYGS